MSRPRKTTTPLQVLERPCGRCGHQNAVHTGGRDRSRWAPYDPVWVNATGRCNQPGCDCPARTASAAGTAKGDAA